MSARKVSRDPYRVRRDPREVWVAVAVALAIVLVTAVVVWILAPDDDSPSTPSTPLTLPAETPSTTLDPSVTTVPTSDPTATTAPPDG